MGQDTRRDGQCKMVCSVLSPGCIQTGVLLSVLGHEDVPFRKITGLIKRTRMHYREKLNLGADFTVCWSPYWDSLAI